MEDTDKKSKLVQAYEHKFLGNLTVQNAILIILVYAAGLDPDDCKNDIQRIERIVRYDPVFKELNDIITQINYQANMFRTLDPLQALETAGSFLDTEHRRKAIELAVKVTRSEIPPNDNRKIILDNLAVALKVDKKIVRDILKGN